MDTLEKYLISKKGVMCSFQGSGVVTCYRKVGCLVCFFGFLKFGQGQDVEVPLFELRIR